MDAALLAEAYDDLVVKMPTIQALAVIRHGCLVFERHNAHARLDPASAVLRGLLLGAAKMGHAPPLTFYDSLDGIWNVRSAWYALTRRPGSVVRRSFSFPTWIWCWWPRPEPASSVTGELS
jgi:hypothetical protein